MIGTYYHSLDSKNRIRMPAKVKSHMGDDFVFFKAPGPCIYVVPRTIEAEIERKIDNITIFDPAQMDISKVYAGFSEAAMDEQGRITISAKLKEYAEIDKNVVTLCVGSRLEIWAEEVRTEFENNSNYDPFRKEKAYLDAVQKVMVKTEKSEGN